MKELREGQIDLERVVTDPEYRRHVIVYLNTQARGRENARAMNGRAAVLTKTLRAENGAYPALRRLG